MHLLYGPFECLLPGHDDPPCQLLESGKLAERSHPLLGLLAEHQVGRLVSASPGPGQDQQILAVAGAELLADLVPEIGIDRRPALDFLRWAGHIDRGGEQLLIAIPEEQHVDTVVLVALDPPKVREVGPSVHLGMTVGVDSPPVLSDDRVPHAPAHLSRFAVPPGCDCNLTDPVDQERAVFGRLDDPLSRNVVHAVLHIGRGVSVRGVEEELTPVEIGNPVLEPLPHRFNDPVADHDQIA